MRASRRHLLSLAASLALAAFALPAHAQSGDPVAIVKGIMAGYVADRLAKPPYSPAVAARLAKADIGADFIIDGQDYEVANVAVSETGRTPTSVVVVARFTNFKEARITEFDFRVVDGAWMIANVRGLHNNPPFDLRKTLKLPPAK